MHSDSTSKKNRDRRPWTGEEDALLRRAAELEEPGNTSPSHWNAIATHVPGRTNKDCRKRWYSRLAMGTDVVRGGWSEEEDARLLSAIECFGTKWSVVAAMVQTRNSDQCAKRWNETLNPSIDRGAWTPQLDELLVQAVNEHGKLWTKIVKLHFPGRTGLAAKNRYNALTKASSSTSPSSRPRARARQRTRRQRHRAASVESATSTSYAASHSQSASPLSDCLSLELDPELEAFFSQVHAEPPHDGWQAGFNGLLAPPPLTMDAAAECSYSRRSSCSSITSSSTTMSAPGYDVDVDIATFLAQLDPTPAAPGPEWLGVGVDVGMGMSYQQQQHQQQRRQSFISVPPPLLDPQPILVPPAHGDLGSLIPSSFVVGPGTGPSLGFPGPGPAARPIV
ncbi:hypothetical protein MKEN_00962000 [Mycena kentingensis (nom. inval.)]|nr:hypothetical protein MKEN_00962000 [Mycena kentingensis (nom. inval.)]